MGGIAWIWGKHYWNILYLIFSLMMLKKVFPRGNKCLLQMNTKIQIRKAFTDVKKFHLKVDNEMRFILEKCRLIITMHLGKNNLQYRPSASEWASSGQNTELARGSEKSVFAMWYCRKSSTICAGADAANLHLFSERQRSWRLMLKPTSFPWYIFISMSIFFRISTKQVLSNVVRCRGNCHCWHWGRGKRQ